MNAIASKVCSRALLVSERQLAPGADVPEARIPEVFDALGVALLTLPGQRQATQSAMLAAAQQLLRTERHLKRLADMYFANEEVVRGAVIATLAELKKTAAVQDGSLAVGPHVACFGRGRSTASTRRWRARRSRCLAWRLTSRASTS